MGVHAVHWEGTGPVVVAVHGMVVAGRSMFPLADRLARRGCQVWVPDLPGFGLSDKPWRALDVPSLADQLAHWLRAAGVGPSVVLGNSFGTQVAAALAARHPETTRRLVLLAPTIDVRWRHKVPDLMRRALRSSPPVQPRVIRSSWRRILSERLVTHPRPDDHPSLRRLILTEYAAAGPFRAVSTYRHAIDDAIEDRLPAMAVPVLVARGELDNLVSREWAESLSRRPAEGSYVEIPGVTHDGAYQEPEEVAGRLWPFIGAGPPGAVASGRPDAAGL